MNSKVTVKKESKVTININGEDYVYTEDEARALYEGLCELFQTDKQPPKSDLDDLREYFNKWGETEKQKLKKDYGDWWTAPWKQPDYKEKCPMYLV